MSTVIILLNAAALLIVSISMLARANDLRWKKGLRWQTRLVGLALGGVMPWGVIIVEFANGLLPTLYELGFRVGIAMVFLTTPYLPPWHKYITKGDEA